MNPHAGEGGAAARPRQQWQRAVGVTSPGSSGSDSAAGAGDDSDQEGTGSAGRGGLKMKAGGASPRSELGRWQSQCSGWAGREVSAPVNLLFSSWGKTSFFFSPSCPVCSSLGRAAGNGSFHCRYCPYSSSCRTTMRQHEQRHTGDKPYKCHFCSYAAVRKGQVRSRFFVTLFVFPVSSWLPRLALRFRASRCMLCLDARSTGGGP